MRAFTYRTIVGLGVSALALMQAAPAAAQTASPAASDAPSIGSQTTDDAAAPPESLGDIVVTANKRPETVQSVGAAVSVVTGDRLQEQKKAQLADYVSLLAGVTANSTGTPGQTSLTIRGISPLSAGSKVATYIDESPLGSGGIWAQAGGLTLDLLPFDLDRLELLRGPQGTLYGAGSMGGLLKYVLKTPSTTKLSLDIGGDVAAIDGAGKPAGTVQGRVSIPVVRDLLALSVSGFYRYVPGYIDNAYNGGQDVNRVRQYGGRAAVFFQPASNLTVKLNALLQKTDAADDALVSYASPTVTIPTTTSPRIITGGVAYGPLTESKAFAQAFASKVDFYSGTIDWDVGPFTVVSATSWSRYDVRRVGDRSLSYGTYLTALGLSEGLVRGTTELGNRKFTQEVRLLSPEGHLIAWQIGGFYTNEHQSNLQLQDAFSKAYVPITALQPHASYITIPTTYREYAAFGDVTLTFSPKFDVSGGVRYSRNRQAFTISAQGILAGVSQTTLTTLPTVRSSEDNTTWSAGARYHVTRDVMAYVRVATGYAPGGANTPYPGVPQATVGSETLTSYEAGLKSQFLDRRALFNLSVFRIDWDDIQLAARLGAIGYTANGGSARSQGVEATASVEPTRGLVFGLNAAYTDARLTRLNPSVTTAFIVGQRLQQVPEWAISETADYGFALNDRWKAHLGGVIRFVDKELGAQPATGVPLFTLPSYVMGDLLASVTEGTYTFGVYVRNVGNSRAISGGYPYVDRTNGIRQIDYYIAQPRTVGLSASARF